MTKEEIIEFCEMKAELEAENEDIYEAIIKALEQEPCEDCISREAVLDKAYAYGNGLEPDGYCVNVEDIQALLPVTPQQNKGEWIDIEYFDREWTCYRPKCPFCNAEPKEYSNYCPNCGAKLKEENPDY